MREEEEIPTATVYLLAAHKPSQSVSSSSSYTPADLDASSTHPFLSFPPTSTTTSNPSAPNSPNDMSRDDFFTQDDEDDNPILPFAFPQKN